AELGELVALLGSEGADAADLDADGTEVCEAAKRKRGDGEGARIERVLNLAQFGESDELVEDHAGAEQIADGGGVVPRDGTQPGYGSEDPTENLLEAVGEPGNVHVHPAHHGVEEGQEGEKDDEHRADVESQVQTIDGAARDGSQDVGLFLRFGHLH